MSQLGLHTGLQITYEPRSQAANRRPGMFDAKGGRMQDEDWQIAMPFSAAIHGLDAGSRCSRPLSP